MITIGSFCFYLYYDVFPQNVSVIRQYTHGGILKVRSFL